MLAEDARVASVDDTGGCPMNLTKILITAGVLACGSAVAVAQESSSGQVNKPAESPLAQVNKSAEAPWTKMNKRADCDPPLAQIYRPTECESPLAQATK
jgi:hypothetical protein